MGYISKIFGKQYHLEFKTTYEGATHFVNNVDKYKVYMFRPYEQQATFIRSAGLHYRTKAKPYFYYETQKATNKNLYLSPKGLMKALAQEKHREYTNNYERFSYRPPASYSNTCKEVAEMAWRPSRFLIKGELDNTQPGKVTGWMRFAGIRGKVRFDLKGDFHRDIRGTKIKFKGDASGHEIEAKTSMKGFSKLQVGKAGDITAGFEPADYVKGYCYIEWYSVANGRVVLELEQSKVKVIGKQISANQCKPISREEQHRNLVEFLEQVAKQLSIAG
jgi:hypothetical protein